MWEGENLKKLFGSPVWTGCHSAHRRSLSGNQIIQDEKFWLPLLGLFHGNRLEEFAQLRRGDVKQQDGIWFFDITDGDGRQLKNEQSKRRVPIHPQIVKIGFLRYLEALPEDATGLVFPELKPGGADRKLGHSFTKWWTRYRREVGVYAPGLDYHSFRHGVTTKLINAGVQPRLVDELTGHEGKGTSAAIYYKGAGLQELRAALAKIVWPEVNLAILETLPE